MPNFNLSNYEAYCAMSSIAWTSRERGGCT